jgi:hypothetical protein
VKGKVGGAYDLALVFLLLRLRRRTRFFLHLALILSASGLRGMRSAGEYFKHCAAALRMGARSEGQVASSIGAPDSNWEAAVGTYFAVEMSVVGWRREVGGAASRFFVLCGASLSEAALAVCWASRLASADHAAPRH